jgi:thermitase
MALGINAVREKKETGAFVPGELLVQFKADVPEAAAKRLIQEAGASLKQRIGPDPLYLVSFPEKTPVERMLARFKKLPEVDFAEPNGIVQGLFLDWVFPAEAYAEPAKSTLGAGATVKVAVIDTAIDAGHPALAGKIVSGYNFTNSSTNTQSTGSGVDWHGTAVSGRILDGAGDANVQIMPVTALSAGGSGTWANVINAVNYAADNGATVINLSLGGSGYSEALQRSIDRANEKGVVVVAASGNTGADQKFYPAAYRGVISVAATNEAGQKASFSTYNSTVDISAPGATQKLLTHGGGTRSSQGTSFSAPFITGMVAMLKSAFPFLTGSQVETVLKTKAQSLEGKNASKYNGKLGAGFLNALDVGRWMREIRDGTFRFPWQSAPPKTGPPVVAPPQPIPQTPWLARGKGHKGTYVLSPNGDVVVPESKK